MPLIFSAYKLWVDTTLAVTIGIPATDESPHSMILVSTIVPISPLSDTVTITIQIANFFVPQFSGIVRPISFGPHEQILNRSRWTDLGYLGGAVFAFTLGIYFLFLFSLKSERNISFLFAATCMVVGLRYLVDGPQIILLY
jgi:hypothetical protein